MATDLDRPNPHLSQNDMRHEVDALHALLDAQMSAIRDNLEGVHRAIEAAPVAQKAAVETAMAAAEKAVNAALLAAKSAVEQAAIAHAREHELMAEALKQQQAAYITDKGQQNEWRATINDLASLKMDSSQVRALFDGLDTRMKSIEEELATTRGAVSAQRTAQQGQMWAFGAAISVFALLIGIGSVAVNHLWK